MNLRDWKPFVLVWLVLFSLIGVLWGSTELRKTMLGSHRALELSCEELARDGPCGKVNIVLTEFACGTSGAVIYTERNRPAQISAYLPLVPLRSDGLLTRNEDIRVVIYFPHVRNERELDQLLGQETLACTVLTPGDLLEPGRLLMRMYPGLDVSQCWIIRHGAATPNLTEALAIICVGAIVCVSGVIGLCRLRYKPSTNRQAAVCLATGIASCLLSVHLFLWLVRSRALSELAWSIPILLGYVGVSCCSVGGMFLLFGMRMHGGRFRFSRSKQRPIEVTANGFSVAGRHGPREFLDKQVQAIAVEEKPNYASGVLESVTRKLTLWVESVDELEPIRASEQLYTGEADPYAPFSARVLNDVTLRARAELEAGRSVSGHGWTLDRNALHLESMPLGEDLPLRGLTVARLRTDHLLIWRGTESRPAVRIPRGSQNALLLAKLLDERLPQKPPTADDPLGRVLYEDRPERFSWKLLLICLFFGLVTLVGYLTDWVGPPHSFICKVLAPLMLVAVPAIVLKEARESFRYHEHGVCKVTRSQESRLLFADLSYFTYTATRVFHEGIYAGTTVVLRFEAGPERKGETIAYSTMVEGGSKELTLVRDEVSQLLADRMLAELEHGRAVPWTTDMRLHHGGIELVAQVASDGGPTIIPFDEVHSWDFDEGFFMLRVREDPKPCVRVSANQPNFVPGYLLFQRMVEQRFCERIESAL